uniref:Cardiomyopathy-associated protein 5 n=1 Tax=Lygus hesperus TaxID=30085 RepID=A0A0A9YZM1_LYGHE
MSGIQMNHTSLHPSITLQGKSGTDYFLTGNQAIVPTIEWISYYYSLVTIIEDMNMREDIVPRVVIISYNILTGNTFRLTKVDLVVEYLPSGECSAVLHIASIKVTLSSEVTSSIISRALLLFLSFVHILIAVAEVSTQGFKTYITRWYGIVKIVLSLTGVLMFFTTLMCYLPQYLVLDRLFKLPSDTYMDLHDLHDKFSLDSIALTLFLFVMCVDLAVAVKDALNLRIITAVSASGFRMSWNMILIIMIYSRAASLSSNMSYSFLVPVFFKALFPLPSRDDEDQVFLLLAIIIVSVCSKFCLAIFVYHLEVFDRDFISDYHPGKLATDRSIRPLRDTLAVKMRYIKKHSVRSQVSTLSRKSENSGSSSPMKNTESKKSTFLTKKRSRASKSEPPVTGTDNPPPGTSEETETDGGRKLEARTSKLHQKFFNRS